MQPRKHEDFEDHEEKKKVFFVLLREFRAFVVPAETITAGVNTNATTKTHSEIRNIRRNA
jgi:hypothetical protein